MTHLLLLVLFAGAAGLVLGATLRSGRERVLRLAAWIALALIGTAVVLGWVLYLLPR